jgi:hypothetical protein
MAIGAALVGAVHGDRLHLHRRGRAAAWRRSLCSRRRGAPLDDQRSTALLGTALEDLRAHRSVSWGRLPRDHPGHARARDAARVRVRCVPRPRRRHARISRAARADALRALAPLGARAGKSGARRGSRRSPLRRCCS